MRISDWSSDVCSSDLAQNFPDGPRRGCGADESCGCPPGSAGRNPSNEGASRSASTHAQQTARNGRGRPSAVTGLMRSSRWARFQAGPRSEEHTSELQSLMRISYAVFCLKKKTTNRKNKK